MHNATLIPQKKTINAIQSHVRRVVCFLETLIPAMAENLEFHSHCCFVCDED